MKRLRLFLADCSGATAVEYALIAVLISVAVIGGATALGSAMKTKFEYIHDQVAAVKP